MSTTTEATRISPRTSIFDHVIQNTEQREAAREADALLKKQAADEVRNARAAEERAAQTARDKAAALNRSVDNFQTKFFYSIVKTDWFKNLKSTAQREVSRYCEALASSDMALPSLDPSMASVVHDKFAYGIKLAGDNIPESYFVGQRQGWFPELLNKKLGLDRPAKIVIAPAPAALSVKVSQSIPAAKVEIPLPSAITLKAKRTKGGQPKR
jgi:hypothetical protein